MKSKQIVKPFFVIWVACFICLLPASKVLAQQPETQPPRTEQPEPGFETQQQQTEQQESQQPETQPSIQLRNDFSDTELKSFVKVNEKVTVIQKESEQKMIKAIEDKGLTVNRFNEILELQRDPQKKTDASQEELTSFNSAAQVIIEENQKLEKQMTTSIEEEGMDIDTYKEIMIAYQQNPTIQSKINKLIGGDN